MNEVSLHKIKNAVSGLPHQFVGVIPFSHEITSDIPLDGVDYIPYGSTLLTNISAERGFTGLHFNMETFNYSAAIDNKCKMLNGTYCMTAAEVIEFMKVEDPQSSWFIRPSHDLKQFSGTVETAGDAVKWFQSMIECHFAGGGSYSIAPDTEIIVDHPVKIVAEWRWFIVGGKIVDGSMYRHQGALYKQHEDDSAVIAEATELASTWLPDSCCVMDTALIQNGDEYDVRIVEFNTINSSGFYDNDVEVIVKSLWDYHNK